MNYRQAISRNYTRQLYKHIHVVYHICLTCLLLLLISKILKGLDYVNTTLVDCLFSRDDFDCSVIHTWGNDESKASCDWRSHHTTNVAQTPSRKWELNSNWLIAGKECGSVFSSCQWGGALRHDTKNGCVADYPNAASD